MVAVMPVAWRQGGCGAVTAPGVREVQCRLGVVGALDTARLPLAALLRAVPFLLGKC